MFVIQKLSRSARSACCAAASVSANVMGPVAPTKSPILMAVSSSLASVRRTPKGR